MVRATTTLVRSDSRKGFDQLGWGGEKCGLTLFSGSEAVQEWGDPELRQVGWRECEEFKQVGCRVEGEYAALPTLQHLLVPLGVRKKQKEECCPILFSGWEAEIEKSRDELKQVMVKRGHTFSAPLRYLRRCAAGLGGRGGAPNSAGSAAAGLGPGRGRVPARSRGRGGSGGASSCSSSSMGGSTCERTDASDGYRLMPAGLGGRGGTAFSKGAAEERPAAASGERGDGERPNWSAAKPRPA